MEAWRTGQENSVAAHQVFQIEAPFRKACGWTQAYPSIQLLFLPCLPPYLHSPVPQPSTTPTTGCTGHSSRSPVSTFSQASTKLQLVLTPPSDPDSPQTASFVPPLAQDLYRFTSHFPRTELMVSSSRNTSYTIPAMPSINLSFLKLSSDSPFPGSSHLQFVCGAWS